MGKYINRNSKSTNQVSLIDGGVRTRARTLALRQATGSYIQLRSRRLVKPADPKRVPAKSNKGCGKSANSAGVKGNSGNSSGSGRKVVGVGEESPIRVSDDLGSDGDGSFGENVMEIEAIGRSTRETTPSNLIRDPETLTTPGSSTKRAYSNNANYRVQTSAPRVIPLIVELDAMFTEPEKKQQELFIEKYNFDPVNDKPLPGRYEWVKVDGAGNAN
ncbi:cyclin-dependent kinase inhibitor 4-like [Bidens hawaiensis]|uniref:cyclin-dependent kinase inhibitor 4-like n=1 Tax=Bidens hawaiensis TaxID=980011 RepID=UPI0040499347